MLLSLSLMILVSLSLSRLLQGLKMPPLIGMLLAGIVLGPYGLNLISPAILSISTDLRQIALIIILTRAGLALNVSDLKKVGRPAFFMSFLPATFEIIVITLVAPLFFGISYLEAAILGTVLGAVSPAVVVPQMLKLLEKGYGKKQGVPQLILAGASVDDIYVIVWFSCFMEIYQSGHFSAQLLLTIPISIIVGCVIGFLTGSLLVKLFKHFHIRDTVKLLIIIALAFAIVSMEKTVQVWLPMSGLLAVMVLGITLLQQYKVLAERLSERFSKIWIAAELMLFILVGASVDINYVANAGLLALLLILLALVFRSIGVFISLMQTPLTKKERLFCAISYLPKATVQAAIGGLPLAAGVGAGKLILTVAVLAILVTAPLGAIGINQSYPHLLKKD